MSNADPLRPETWPTEPPKEDGYYFALRPGWSRPDIATIYQSLSLGRWTTWLRGGLDDIERVPLSSCADWRFFPTPITPASLRPSPAPDVAALLGDDEIRREAVNYRVCDDNLQQIAAGVWRCDWRAEMSMAHECIAARLRTAARAAGQGEGAT